jgi:two-component system nitrate/nitrite response regulator NarL
MNTKKDKPALTNREFQVMQKVSVGKPNKEIAHELGCEEYTVKSHIKNVFPKLGAKNRVEAALKFLIITGKLNPMNI